MKIIKRLINISCVIAYLTLLVVSGLVLRKYLEQPEKEFLWPGEVSWDAHDRSPMTAEQIELYRPKNQWPLHEDYGVKAVD